MTFHLFLVKIFQFSFYGRDKTYTNRKVLSPATIVLSKVFTEKVIRRKCIMFFHASPPSATFSDTQLSRIAEKQVTHIHQTKAIVDISEKKIYYNRLGRSVSTAVQSGHSKATRPYSDPTYFKTQRFTPQGKVVGNDEQNNNEVIFLMY